MGTNFYFMFMNRKIVVEKREGVELKGLGKQTTYLVYPQRDFSSIEDIDLKKNSEKQSNESTQQTKNIDQDLQDFSSIKHDQQILVDRK